MTIDSEAHDVRHAVLTWTSSAACVGKQELFFMDHMLVTVRKAKEICAGCAVKDKCLEHAMTYQEFGVWGGLTANERRLLRRKLRKEQKKKINLELAGE